MNRVEAHTNRIAGAVLKRCPANQITWGVPRQGSKSWRHFLPRDSYSVAALMPQSLNPCAEISAINNEQLGLSPRRSQRLGPPPHASSSTSSPFEVNGAWFLKPSMEQIQKKRASRRQALCSRLEHCRVLGGAAINPSMCSGLLHQVVHLRLVPMNISDFTDSNRRTQLRLSRCARGKQAVPGGRRQLVAAIAGKRQCHANSRSTTAIGAHYERPVQQTEKRVANT